MLKNLPLMGLIITFSSGQYDYVSDCPEDNGFFADALQCDRYYECTDGEVSEHFCPDGLVFDEASTAYAKCGFPFSVDCTGRDERQPAQPSPGCPHQHGYFPVPDETVCNKFNFCVDGVPNTITCAGGLIFDPEKGQCAYSDQTSRVGCTSGDLFGFRCPKESLGAREYSRHPDPEDCQFFYLCIEGKARRNGCGFGDVFDTVSLSCVRQDKVDGPCGNWYNQTFLESLNGPKEITPAIVSNRIGNQEERRRPSRPALPRRQQQFEERLPEQPLPPQLADLERFGQPKAPAFRQNQQNQPSNNSRLPVTRGRQRVRSQVPRRPMQQQKDFVEPPRLQSDKRDSFLTNLRTATRQEERVQTPFTRPPRRRPAEIPQSEAPELINSVPALPAQDENFGQRQSFETRGQQSTTSVEDPDNDLDLLEQVEAELARRKLTTSQNLGPADLDALVSRGPTPQQETFLPAPVTNQRVPFSRGGAPSRGGIGRGRGAVRRVPVSRGSDDISDEVDIRQQGRSRGRLEVIENRRPPLQKFDEDESEFDKFTRGRQRNRG